MFPLVSSSHDLVLHEAVITLTHSIKDDSSIPLVYFLPLQIVWSPAAHYSYGCSPVQQYNLEATLFLI